MAVRVYLDTSAYLAILLDEAGGRELTDYLAKKSLCSSTVLLLETHRNLVRLSREKILSLKNFEKAYRQFREDQDLFILKDATPELCLSEIFPAVRLPRSIDLLHLRTARWYSENGGLDAFVSLDQGQIEAARELTLPLWEGG